LTHLSALSKASTLIRLVGFWSAAQRPWWLSKFSPDELWHSTSALVSALSAFLLAHARLASPSRCQQALLLQASAQLASLPCDPCLHPILHVNPH